MTTAAIVILVLISMDFAISLAKHGEERTNYNAGIAFISYCTWILLLWWAGLFG